MRKILITVEAIPYETVKEWQKIIIKYRKNSIIRTYRNFVYVERITGVEE